MEIKDYMTLKREFIKLQSGQNTGLRFDEWLIDKINDSIEKIDELEKELKRLKNLQSDGVDKTITDFFPKDEYINETRGEVKTNLSGCTIFNFISSQHRGEQRFCCKRCDKKNAPKDYSNEQ